MWSIVAGVVVLFGTSFASRALRERALRLLTPEEKARLLDAFSRSRIVFPSLGLGVLVLFILSVALGAPLRPAFLGALVAPWAVLMAWSYVAVMKKLRSLDLPPLCVRTFHRAHWISYGGLGLFLVLVVFGVVTAQP